MKTIYQYKVWDSAFSNKLSSEELDKYLNKAGEEGYRLV